MFGSKISEWERGRGGAEGFVGLYVYVTNNMDVALLYLILLNSILNITRKIINAFLQLIIYYIMFLQRKFI